MNFLRATKFLLIPASTALLLNGCVGPSKTLGIVETEQAKIQSADVILAETLPRDAALIGPVTGTSCKNKLWDPEPTNEEALLQLRAKAQALGAKGVSGVNYSTDPKTSLVANCWSAIYAVGVAFK